MVPDAKHSSTWVIQAEEYDACRGKSTAGIAVCMRLADHAAMSLVSISVVARRAAPLAACALLACGQAPAAHEPARPLSAPKRHVVIVSVDGLKPQTYTEPDTHGLKVPTLRELARTGAFSPGVMGVLPTVTYPSHTTIATGVLPGEHGVVSNHSFDPTGQNREGWYWYSEDIKVPTLWQIAEDAGLRTALVNWPVTMGARVDALVPEYWRAGTPDDQKLARAIATPGLLEAVAAEHPGFWDGFKPPNVSDKVSIDVAIHLVRTIQPELMMIHIWETDDHHHASGPWSEPANASVEAADAQLGRLIDALKAQGMWERTLFVVVSDHGFEPIEKSVNFGVMLRQLGLVTPGTKDVLAGWKAAFTANGGSAYFYVADEADTATKEALLRHLQPLVGQPGSYVGRLLTREDIVAQGGDPRAFLCVDMAPGFTVGKGFPDAEVVVDTSDRGMHGYFPDRPELRASLILRAPDIAPGAIEDARLMDVAPTVAAWLGLSMPTAKGRVLVTPTAR